MGRARYDETNPTSSNWIGDIPSHWSVQRVKHVARLATGHTPSRANDTYWANCNIPWVALADVTRLRSLEVDELEETVENVSEIGIANSAARLLPAGTVVLSRTASVGFTALLGRPMATSQHYFNWVCGDRLRPRFLMYCFRAMRDEFERIADGSTHGTIYWADGERLTIPLPPIEEQDSIVAALDAECSRIRRLLRLKRILLARLIERADSLVTKGCLGEKNEPTSDDPAYGWLPPLAEGWSMVPLKHLAPFISRGTAPDYVISGGTPVLGQSCVYWDGLKLENARLHGEDHVAGLRGLLRRGDVLINSTGTGTLGRATVFDEQATYLADGHVTIVRVKQHEILPHYLAYLLRSGAYRAFVDQVLTVGSTDQQELSRDKLARAPIILPPIEVQQQIVDHLDEELGPNQVAQAKTRQHLELLDDYRYGLTYAAVTGRIRID